MSAPGWKISPRNGRERTQCRSCVCENFGAYFVLAQCPLRLLFFAFVRLTHLAALDRPDPSLTTR